MFSFLLQTSIVFVLLSNVLSSSIIEKSLKRRQADTVPCSAIQGFECKCSYYRLTCTTDRDLPSQINVGDEEKGKYQSVELVIAAQRDIQVNDRTFEAIKSVFKLETDNLEFRVKFEKFLSLQLSSPGIFNNIFPETSSSTVRKHIALEIYNPEVPPQENKYLFQNLKADSLELYALYPFHGTFQELFNGANIKYLRLSGGDIRSDLNQPFSGNIARLELAKQASALSIQNFPIYPAHELIINAFYITEFQTDNPPNYNNLGELRVQSPERIPANAFRQFPNIHTLSVSTETGIDMQAFYGLNKLEKLVIKDTLPSIDLINTVPQIKELEANIEKLDANTQCQLLEKLTSGQLALHAAPNARDCTCLSAFLDFLSGRSTCDAQNCDQSSCPAIRNNYDGEKKTFINPTAIYRHDGTDAFRPRDPKVYAGAYQVTNEDRLKFERVFPSQQPSEDNQNQQEPDSSSDHHPAVIDEDNRREDNGDQKTDDRDQQSDADDRKNDDDIEEDIWANSDGKSDIDQQETLTTHAAENHIHNPDDDDNDEKTSSTNSDEEPLNPSKDQNEEQPDEEKSTISHSNDFDKPASVDEDQSKTNAENDGDEDNNNSDNKNDENGQNNDEKDKASDGKSSEETGSDEDQSGKSDAEKSNAAKKSFNWLPVIIVIAAFVGLLLLGVIFYVIQQRKKKRGTPIPTDETQANQS